MRLAKFLSLAGVSSRREAEKLISQGKVKVNGEIHKELGKQIDEDKDEVSFKGKVLKVDPKVYYLVHKPKGYLSSKKRFKQDKLVTDLVPKSPAVYPAGRLDKDSTGLIILTNDGDLALKLTHPRYQVKKDYLVTLDKELTPEVKNKLLRGIKLTEGKAVVDSVEEIKPKVCKLTIHQGWNRQIRRMFGKLGITVLELKRVKEGKIALGDLKPGEFKKLSLKDFK